MGMNCVLWIGRVRFLWNENTKSIFEDTLGNIDTQDLSVDFLISSDLTEEISHKLREIRIHSKAFIDRPFKILRDKYYFYTHLQDQLGRTVNVGVVKRNGEPIAYGGFKQDKGALPISRILFFYGLCIRWTLFNKRIASRNE